MIDSLNGIKRKESLFSFIFVEWDEDWIDLLLSASFIKDKSFNYGVMGYKFSSQPAIHFNLLSHSTFIYLPSL